MFPFDNVGNLNFADAELSSQRGVGMDTGRMKGSNLNYFSIAKLCLVILTALGAAPFLYHVGHVVSMTSKKEMRWVDAGWIVAIVTDEQSIRNRTVVQLPRNARSQEVLSAHGNMPVSIAVPPSSPEPTTFRLLHSGPKPIYERFTLVYAGALRGTASFRVGATGQGSKFGPTNSALDYSRLGLSSVPWSGRGAGLGTVYLPTETASKGFVADRADLGKTVASRKGDHAMIIDKFRQYAMRDCL